MAYHKFFPSPVLKPYVFFYYIWEYEQPLGKPLEVHSPPKGFGGMVINFGEPYYIAKDKQEWEKVPDGFLAGQFTKNFTLRLQGKVGMIGIVFLPAALSHLLNIPMQELTNQRVNLPLIFGNDSSALTEQIGLAETHAERLKIIEHFLIKILRKSKARLDVVDYALSNIMKQNGNLSIENLSEDLCMSMRHFRRRFTEKIGISPKLYARIKRFNHITLLTETASANWADMVCSGGYYDQAHFIHDFYDFSGKKPSEFINYNRILSQLIKA